MNCLKLLIKRYIIWLHSIEPDEQAPPTVMPASPTSVLVTWLEPEAPNGLIISYTVYRDGSPVATVTTLNYADINLIPNTRYLYSIEAVNSVGTTRSVEVEVQTLEGIPEGIDPPTLTVLSAYSVRVLWVEPATPNGMVVRYEAVIVRLESEQIIVEEISVFNTTGDVFTAVVSNLTPFTIYNFIIRACTSGGCGSSEPLAEVQTLQAPPTFQPAPNVTTISSQELLVNWVVPPIPNGIVSRYEVFLRDFPFSGVGESLTNTSELSFLTQGLRPFAAYEFSVASFTAGGGVLSAWVQGTTGEAGKCVCVSVCVRGITAEAGECVCVSVCVRGTTAEVGECVCECVCVRGITAEAGECVCVGDYCRGW